jgi:uncharacterized membrane protein YdbT with pleckstrin-like domain
VGGFLGLIAMTEFVTAVEGTGVGFLLLLLAVVIVCVGILRWTSTEMAVTNKRVIVKTGVLTQKSLEIPLNKVESIGVNQGILGRVLGYGNVVVRGTGGTPEPFEDIAAPLEFRHQVQAQMDK